jgi:hypothetical protein
MLMDRHTRAWLLLSLALSTACGSASTGGDVPDAAAGANDAGSSDVSFGSTDSGPGTDGPSSGDGASPDTGSASPEAGGASPEAGGASPEAGDAGAIRYDQNGPIAFTTSTAIVQNGADSFTENIYLPSSAGTHPVVSLTPGLQQPSAAYAPYSERLASYGIVVLVRDDPGLLTQSQVIAADVAYMVGTWLPAQNGDPSSPLYAKVDLTKVGLTGHSRGGQATLLAAEGALKGQVVAWFGIDPDDPGTIDGFVESTMVAVTTLGTIGIPTTFLGGQVTTFCTPANINYEVLYAAAPSPSVVITGVNASHTEFEVPSACVDCSLCAPMGTANPQVVLDYGVRYLTAFFAWELLGDASVGTTFQGAGATADQAAGLVQIMSK